MYKRQAKGIGKQSVLSECALLAYVLLLISFEARAVPESENLFFIPYPLGIVICCNNVKNSIEFVYNKIHKPY